jgi:glycosyltransferase involved in cell wall biosynthesis
MLRKEQRSLAVFISEPHLYSPYARYGGHQYAKVFSRHGWQVILLSASFNLWRLVLPNPGIDRKYIDLWRKRGQQVDDGIVNYCLAHALPTSLRFLPIVNRIAWALYVPSIRSVLNGLGIRKVDLLWLHGNQDWLLKRAIPYRKLVVRIIDDYSAYGYENFHPLMRETLAAADGVFACSEHVRRVFSSFFPDIEIKVVPNGVDFEHFANYAGEELEIVKGIRPPRVVYVGAIAKWFDFDLVIELASRLPDCSFIIAGNWQREVPAVGTYPKNIFIIGPVEYDKLPALLTKSDVGIVPFKDTDLVQGVSPIKVYEYLASGLPAVCLRWPELERESLPVFLAKTADEFEVGIRAALAMPRDQRENLREAARECSWERRLQDILEHIGLGLDIEETWMMQKKGTGLQGHNA